MYQVLQGGTTFVGTGNRRYPIDTFLPSSSDFNTVEMKFAEAGVLENFHLTLGTAPGAGTSRTWTVRKNDVSQTLVVVIADAATDGVDTTHTVTVAAGDKIHLLAQVSGSPANSVARWSFEFTPTASNRAVWGTSSAAMTSVSGVRYGPIGGTAANGVADTLVANSNCPWAVPGAIVSLYVETDTAPGVGKTWTFDIMLDGVAVGSTVTIAGTNLTGNATGMSIAIIVGSLLSFRWTSDVAGINCYLKYGIAYAPTTDGQWNISGEDREDPVTGRFLPLNSVIAANATESNVIELADPADTVTDNWQLHTIHWITNTAPGGAETRTLTYRKTGSDTALLATITGAGTSATAVVTPVTHTTNDYSSLKIEKSASAAGSSGFRWALAAGPVTPAAAAGGSRLLLGVGT